MPSFQWKGKSAEGFEVKGKTKAPSKESVIAQLRTNRIIVSSITEFGDAGQSGRGGILLKGVLIVAGLLFLMLLAAVLSRL